VTEPAEIRSALDDKRVFVMPYCHADIAWEHTRRWHVDRYVLVFDEILRLTESEPGFRHFFDSWCEMLEPCLVHRPASEAKVRALVAEGRLAICGGHWANLRMTQVGDETILRNLILGRREVRRRFPHADLRVYANLDVAIGHSQVPQILQLAGCPFYFGWRPQAALDAAGVPRSFWWEGLSGHRVLVTRHCYSGLSVDERPAGGWDADWDATLQAMWTYLEQPVGQSGLRTLSFCVGRDDSRPLRDGGDVLLDVPGLIAAWNRRERSRMTFGTPLDVFEALTEQSGDLPAVTGVLDEAEVCYKAAMHGRRGLWWIREAADRRLIEAELFSSVASLQGGDYPEPELTSAWQDLLSICAHAQQALFGEDFDEAVLRGCGVIRSARRLASEAVARLVPGALPHESTCLTLVNPLPEPRHEVVRVLLPRADRGRHGVRFVDGRGRDVPCQLLESLVNGDEMDLLVAGDLPACGATTLRMHWTDQALDEPAWQDAATPTVTLASDRLELTLVDGCLRRIVDRATGQALDTDEPCGFLAPVLYRYEGSTWMTEAVDPQPVLFDPQSVRIDERGPLRWRVTRKGRLGPHPVVQHLDLPVGGGFVESTTQVIVQEGPTSYVGLAVPVPSSIEMTVDIPFGVEPRDPDAALYGRLSERPYDGLSIERRVPGVFWARSWVRVAREAGALAFMALDGDRFFYLGKDPRLLVHLLIRRAHRPERGWEGRTRLGDEGGPHEFRHALVVGNPTPGDLVRRAARFRQPVRWITTHREPGRESWLEVTPSSVRLSALYREQEAYLLRLVQMADEPAEAMVRLPCPLSEVVAVDLEGRPTDIPVRSEGGQVAVTLQPWQIATLRCVPSPAT